MMLNDEKRGVEEIYASAMTTSNLRVEADRSSDADVIICAGWSQSRIGGALLRLHTAYDSTEKPRMATADQFMPILMEAAVSKTKDGKLSKEDKRLVKNRAHELTHRLNQNQLALFLEKLKALPDVRTQVSLQMLKWGMRDVETKAVEIIRWWLHQICPTCGGTKFQVVEGTHRHNGKACPNCHGSGKSLLPYEQEGRRVACWLDQCVERARASISRRLTGWERTGTRYVAPE